MIIDGKKVADEIYARLLEEAVGKAPGARRGESDARGVPSVRRAHRRGSATTQMDFSDGFLKLGILVGEHNPVTDSFVRIKEKAAARLGVEHDRGWRAGLAREAEVALIERGRAGYVAHLQGDEAGAGNGHDDVLSVSVF